jgi:hypothetical protein
MTIKTKLFEVNGMNKYESHFQNVYLIPTILKI